MIIYFIFINALIFIPAYLLNFKKSTFLPLQLFDKTFRLKNFLANFIRRYNFDIFRFTSDFAILTLMLIILHTILPIALASILVYIYAIFAIIHQTYYHSIKYIYNTEPLIINDVILVKRGLNIAFHGFKFWLAFTFIALFVLGFLLKILCNFFVLSIYESSTLPYLFIAILCFISFCGIYSIKRYTHFKSVYGFLCFIMPTVKFFENVKASIQQKQKLKQLKQVNYKQLNQTNVLQLNIKKNVFFIAVESYGNLIYDKKKFPTFNKLINTLNNQLNQTGWKVASTSSESPISGGASWLSYSTMLKGVHINNESIYSYLFSDDGHLAYQPFMQHLQNNAYHTYWLSSIGGFKKMSIPWNRTLRFLGLQQVIKYADLNYTGKHFGFGPSPPDQYSLHKAHALIKEKIANQPFALFWLTLNSHYPWDSPIQLVDDWQSLNKKKDNYWIDNELDNQKKYEMAMVYQLQVLVNFILKEGTKDDIFILVGDHQPFHIGEINNLNTPLHIISKEKQFIKEFYNFHFNKGLLQNNNLQNNLKHAGIQSLLIKVMNQVYGNALKSTYYKNGIYEF